MKEYMEGDKKKLNIGTMVLNRVTRTDKSTIGDLYINNEFFCYTLEDFDRDFNKDGDIDDVGEEKVYGETAIPAGTYEVKLTMSTRFKRILPLLINVPHFDGIRIHRGNTAKDSLGCIIVGFTKDKDFVGKSKDAEEALIKRLQEFDKIWIEVK